MGKIWFSQDYRKLAQLVIKGYVTMEEAKKYMANVTPYHPVCELEFYKELERYEEKIIKEVQNG